MYVCIYVPVLCVERWVVANRALVWHCRLHSRRHSGRLLWWSEPDRKGSRRLCRPRVKPRQQLLYPLTFASSYIFLYYGSFIFYYLFTFLLYLCTCLFTFTCILLWLLYFMLTIFLFTPLFVYLCAYLFCIYSILYTYYFCSVCVFIW